jgi:hypothetical protein
MESPNPNPDQIYNPQTQIDLTYLEMTGGFDRHQPVQFDIPSINPPLQTLE